MGITGEGSKRGGGKNAAERARLQPRAARGTPDKTRRAGRKTADGVGVAVSVGKRAVRATTRSAPSRRATEAAGWRPVTPHIPRCRGAVPHSDAVRGGGARVSMEARDSPPPE